MQYIFKLIFLFLSLLLVVGFDSFTHKKIRIDYTDISNRTSQIKDIRIKISQGNIYSAISKFKRNIGDLCPIGMSPIFNELNYTCKVDNNNRYLSTKLNSNASYINTFIAQINGIIITGSKNISSIHLITGQSTDINYGESTFRNNILGKKIYIDMNGYKYQAANDVYYKVIFKEKQLPASIPYSTLSNTSSLQRLNDKIGIQGESLENILGQAIFNKESNIEHYTLLIDGMDLNKNKGYITSSILLDYSEADWDAIISAQFDPGNNSVLNNSIRANSNQISNIFSYKSIFKDRTIAQVQGVL